MELSNFDLNKTLFVTHVDLDGICPYILNKFFNIDYDKSISTNYGEDLELDSISSGLYDNIVYVDFTPSDVMKNVIKSSKVENIIVFDHHEASVDGMNTFTDEFGKDKVTYYYDKDRCGTKIYYDYLMENGYKDKTNSVIEELITLVDTYDLYKTDDVNWNVSEKLNRLLYSTGKFYIKDDRFKCFEFFINNILWKIINANKFFFNALEESKIQADIEKEDKLFNDLISNAKTDISTRQDSRGRYFAVITCKSKISAIAHRLMEKYKKLDYVIAINDYDEDNPKISVRSKDGINLLELCNVKGHENACGLSTDEVDNPKEFIEKLSNKEIYELGYRD